MSLKNKIFMLAGVAALAVFAAGSGLRAQTVEVVVEDVPEDEAEDVKSAIAPPVYLGCSRHDFAVQEETGIERCVVCGEELKSLPPDTAVRLSRVLGRLSLRGGLSAASGVLSEPVQKRALFAQARAVGRVTPGTAAAAAEEQPSSVYIYAEVGMPESRWIRPGSGLRMTAEGVPEWTWEGKMSLVQSRYDAATQTLRFQVEVEDPDHRLKPDTQIEVAIRSQYVSPFLAMMVLAVPQEALWDTGTQHFVWVDQGAGDFELRKVELDLPAKGRTADETGRLYCPVLRALSEGERVVTQAAFKN